MQAAQTSSIVPLSILCRLRSHHFPPSFSLLHYPTDVRPPWYHPFAHTPPPSDFGPLTTAKKDIFAPGNHSRRDAPRMTAATAGVNDQVASPSSEPLRQPSPDAALQTESRTVAPLASDKYHPRDRQHQGSGLGWTVEPRHAGKVSKANTAPVLDARSLLGDPGVTRTASNGGSCSHDSHHDHHHHHHHHHHVPHTSVPIAPLGPAGDAVPGGRETDQLELLKYSSVELNNIPQDYLNVSKPL